MMANGYFGSSNAKARLREEILVSREKMKPKRAKSRKKTRLDTHPSVVHMRRRDEIVRLAAKMPKEINKETKCRSLL